MKKLILLFCLVIYIASSCKKQIPITEKVNTEPQAELSKIRTQVLTNLLIAAENEDFREYILNECIKQKHGDYTVRLDDIIYEYKDKPKYKKIMLTLEKFSNSIKTLTNGLIPQIFYPKAETIEQQNHQNFINRSANETIVPLVGVYQNFYLENYSSPGYIIDINNTLSFFQNITEEDAWENDVWVIGEEENVSDENLIAAPEDLTASRVEGQSEYGGMIQCTNLNAIEHWTAGKLEFRMIVYDANGVKRVDRKFGKYKRSNFRDSKWKDFGHFIGNWNTSVFGKWMIENWWEEDGGQTGSITITMPPPSGQTGPTLSATFPSKNRDDDLGVATIQFTDAITQIYNISYANIKRKN